MPIGIWEEEFIFSKLDMQVLCTCISNFGLIGANNLRLM
jgi:hypothetical protein